MLLIILLMVAGILLGALFFSKETSGKALKICGKIQQLATILLLFAMGLWLGENSDFWLNIKLTGLHGFLFAVVTITGSVLAVFLLSKLLLRGDKG